MIKKILKLLSIKTTRGLNEPGSIMPSKSTFDQRELDWHQGRVTSAMLLAMYLQMLPGM